MSRWAAQTSRVRVSAPSRPSPPLYPHFNRPSGFWPCVKSCLVGGSDKYREVTLYYLYFSTVVNSLCLFHQADNIESWWQNLHFHCNGKHKLIDFYSKDGEYFEEGHISIIKKKDVVRINIMQMIWNIKKWNDRHCFQFRVFANGPGNKGSIPDRVIPKTQKVRRYFLASTQHYKVRIKGKVEQSREWSSALPYTSV